MKTITILSLVFFLSFSTQSEEITFDKCMVSLTKEDLLADTIELHCGSFSNNENFSIKNFTIKFPGFPSEVVEGERLSDTARLYAQKLKPNQMVSIFDIKSAYQDGKIVSQKEIPSFYIKIVEPRVAIVD